MIPLPERLSFEQGAAVPVNYGDRLRRPGADGRAAGGRPGPDPCRRRRRRNLRHPDRARRAAPRSSGPRRPPSTRRSAPRGSTTRSTTEPGLRGGRRAADRAARASTSPSTRSARRASARTTACSARAGRLICYGLSEVQTGEGRNIPAVLEEPRVDDDGDDAVVEEHGDHEREQGGLRAQHAPLVGPGGQHRAGRRAALARTSPRGGSTRSWRARSRSTRPPTPIGSSMSAATSARSSSCRDRARRARQPRQLLRRAHRRRRIGCRRSST